MTQIQICASSQTGFTARSTPALRGNLRRYVAAAILAAHVSVLPLAGAAVACAFHLTAPEKSAIDWVLETDHLVIARNTPDTPFAYSVTETLRDGGRTVEIAQLVDSSMRRRFTANPGDGMLFAYDSATDDWRSVAYLTADYREIVDQVLADMGAWGPGYAPERFEIFAALQDHPDAALRQLAILEIDKAPYTMLRDIELDIPVSTLLAELWTPRGYPYQPIRVLLLGLSGEDAARAEIHAFIDRVATWDWANNLGAFATALIEIDGVDGVVRLEQAFLAAPNQPLDKLEQVVEALAIHSGVDRVDVKHQIDQALERLVRKRPEAAALVARQFGSRNDWSHARQFETLVRNKELSSSADLITVAVYVAQAKGAGALLSNPSNGG